MFDVKVQGREVRGVDVFMLANRSAGKVTRKFGKLPVYGWIEIRLRSVKGNAFLSGVSCRMVEGFRRMEQFEKVRLAEKSLFEGGIVEGIGSEDGEDEGGSGDVDEVQGNQSPETEPQEIGLPEESPEAEVDSEPSVSTDGGVSFVPLPEEQDDVPNVVNSTAQPDVAQKVGPVFVISAGATDDEDGTYTLEDPRWIQGRTAVVETLEDIFVDTRVDAVSGFLYKSYRYGLDASTWEYKIPVEEVGTYDCNLHFAESNPQTSQPTQRVFDIEIGGQLISAIDVFREANSKRNAAIIIPVRGIEVEETLDIRLLPLSGNAFISGISCRTAAVDSPVGLTTDQPVPEPSPDAEATSAPEDQVIAPIPGEGTEDESPLPQAPVSPVEEPIPSEEADVSDTSEAASITAKSDEDPLVEGGEYAQSFLLEVDSPNGFNGQLKREIKSLSAMTTSTDISKWAMTKIEAGDDEESYQVGFDVAMEEDDGEDNVEAYKDYVESNGMTRDLEKAGFDGTSVRFMTEPQVTTGNNSSDDNSGLGGKIAAGVLVPLAAIALILLVVFVVRRRRRDYDIDENYDAPPPVDMVESDVSSDDEDVPHGELTKIGEDPVPPPQTTEYFDDDSTFTAATSQAEPTPHIPDGTDKDVWGRGSP